MIATDGVPNDLNSFTRLLASRDVSRIYISILACSDNDKDVGYLNKLDREIQNLGELLLPAFLVLFPREREKQKREGERGRRGRERGREGERGES
jgi:hypothetical protein